jgi:hypothetical protein
VVGLEVDLASEHVILDYGDGEPIGLSGFRAAVISVMAIASVHGLEALIGHPSLAPIRTQNIGDL